MPLDGIIDYIVNESLDEKHKIIKEAQAEAAGILTKGKEEARGVYSSIIEKEKAHAEAEKRRLIVSARLENKKKILKAKQDLVELVFKKAASALTKDILKKEQITQSGIKESPVDLNVYIEKIKFDYEIEVAKILF